MQHYISKEVVCPFYAQETDIAILHNEGVSKGNRVHLSFGGKSTLIKHRDLYCKSIKRYSVCPIYKMLSEKYGDGHG